MVSEVKGASIKFKSYEESVFRLLDILKIHRELKKYDKIVLKPNLTTRIEESTSREFTESVLKFVLMHKNPVAEIFIAEGADGIPTEDLFEMLGYDKLAERYDVSLVDLNRAETQVMENYEFLKFQDVQYPKLLLESFVIVLPKLGFNEETIVNSSLSTMLGAFPAEHYKGFFSKTKNKLRKWPIKYAIHDIVKCKVPDFSIVDGSEQGVILAGLPLEIDKQSARILGKDWKEVPYIKLIEDNQNKKEEDTDYA